MSINFAQFPLPRLPLQGNDLVVGYQLIGSVPTLAQYTLTQMFVGVFPGGIVPIANGGTGATSAAAARTSLGAAPTANPVFATPSGTSLVTIDNAGTQQSTISFKDGGAEKWELGKLNNNDLFIFDSAAGFIAMTAASGGPFIFNRPVVASAISTAAATITGGTSNGMVIGNSTQAAGAFTTLIATGIIMPNQTAGIQGTTTNNNANAGSVGEFLTNTTGPTAVLTGTPMNATSVSLTAGDWDVSGTVAFTYAGGAVVTAVVAGVSTVSAAIGGLGTNTALNIAQGAPAQGETFGTPVVRISIAVTTTVFLVASSNFAGGTGSVSGFIRARRIR